MIPLDVTSSSKKPLPSQQTRQMNIRTLSGILTREPSSRVPQTTRPPKIDSSLISSLQNKTNCRDKTRTGKLSFTQSFVDVEISSTHSYPPDRIIVEQLVHNPAALAPGKWLATRLEYKVGCVPRGSVDDWRKTKITCP